jgi:hypothetical protein
MPNEFCQPFDSCDGLDARLLINTAIEGPPLAWDLGEVSFGSFTAAGVAARPYVDLQLDQTWTAKEICYGPIRSIFSLAPTETVQIAVSVRQQVSVAHLVSSASSDSHSTQGPEPGQYLAPSDDKLKQMDNMIAQKEKQQASLNMASRKVSDYGSFLETLANILAPGIGGAIVNAAQGVTQHVDKTAADGLKDAVDQAGRAVATIERSESQHLHNESTTTTDTTETMQSLTRTFSNPYRDRSLQLRFIPVFRHFEVRTRPSAVRPGISLQVGPSRIADQSVVRVQDVLTNATGRVDPAVLQRPLASMLAETGARATRGATGTADGPPAASGPTPAGALLWSQSTVREDSVLVPLAAPATAAHAFGLKGRSRSEFISSLERFNPEAIARLVPVKTQQVHLFIGTHIEAVAGECVLQDVPPAPPVVD